MGIKIKHTNPTLNEFSTKDLVVNVQSGSLFFKSNTKLFKLQGDDQSTTDITDSLNITGNISASGEGYFSKVGIGTSTPSEKLTIADGSVLIQSANFIQLVIDQTDSGKATFGVTSGTSEAFILSTTNNASFDADIKFLTNDGTTTSEIVRFKEDGKVGIGTSTPAALLHVEVDDDTDNNLVEILHLERHCDDINSSATAEGGYIGLYVDDDNYGGELARISWRADNANNFEGDGRIGFWTAKSTSGNQGGMTLTEKMTINRDGDVMVNSGSLTISGSTSETLLLDRKSGKASVKALGASTYLIMDSNGQKVLINHYVSDHVGLASGGGKVIIGANETPTSKLHVKSDESQLVLLQSTTDDQQAYVKIDSSNAGTNTHSYIYFNEGGNGRGAVGYNASGDDIRLVYDNGIASTNGIVVEPGGSIGMGQSVNPNPNDRLYVQRIVSSSTTGFTCVASFKNPTNATGNQGATAGIKLKLGSTSEHHKWSGIACQSAASFSNTTELTFWPNDTTGGERAVLTSGGNWDIDGSVNPGSDIRWKKNINTIETPLETIKKLRGVTFDWKDEEKDEGKMQHGFIAQEVEKILPNLITNRREYKHMNYSGIIPVLVEALKDQQKQIDELKKQVNG